MQQNKLKKGFAWTTFTQLTKVIIQFVGVVVLARLLSPKEFGLIGMLTIFIEVGNMIADSGMGGSLVKKRDCQLVDFHTLFVFSNFVGIVIYIFLWILAPYIAAFYNEPILISLIRILSLQIIIHSLYVTQYIQLLKALKFEIISVATLSATTIGLIVAIVLALLGAGVWSLVSQFIVEAFLLGVIYCVYQRYLPKIQFSLSSFKEQFAFGVNLLGANLLNVIGNNIHSNVIAKIVNINLTGLFTQSTKVQNLPVSIFTQIIDKALFPVLSQCKDKHEFNSIYMNVYSMVLLVISFVTTFVAFFSYEIVFVILGSKWTECSDILTILSLAILPLAVQSLCRNTLKSKGLTSLILRNQIVKSLLLFFILIVAAYGGFWPIVWGVVVTQVLVAAYIIKITANSTGISCWCHFKVMQPYILSGCISTGIAVAICKYLSISPFLSICAGLLISFLLYVEILRVVGNSEIKIFLQFINKHITRH